jgi:hypothetical protein
MTNKGILCTRNYDVHHISEDILSSLDGQVRTYQSEHSIDCKDEERHFSVDFESCLIYFCLFSGTIKVTNATT